MITAFPKIIKGETIFSIVSKYHIMMHHKYFRPTFRNIFNREYTSFSGINIDFPNNISELHRSTQQYKLKGSKEQWIYDHTSFGYYTYFTKPNTRTKVMNSMLSVNNKGIVFFIGKSPSGVKDFTHMRLCEECLDEDLNKIGIGSWYLLHQLPGVFICDKHNSILKNSNISRRTSILVVPTIKDCMSEGEMPLSIKTMERLTEISRLTKELLFCVRNPLWNHKVIKEGYIGLIKLSGYWKSQETSFTKKIISDIIDFYGEELVKLLYDFHGVSFYSLQKLWSLKKNDSIYHPLFHILLINFLYHSNGIQSSRIGIEEFINNGRSSYHIKSKEKVKLICLNHSCEYFKQSTQCDITQKNSKGKIIYHVDCKECRLKYRINHLPLDTDNYTWDAVIDVGGKLQSKINDMYYIEKLSIYKIAYILKISEYSIKKALNLISTSYVPSPSLKFNREKDRLEWEILINKNLAKPKSDLVKGNYALYKRLYRHDKEWLFSRPYNKVPRTKAATVDWKNRDEEIVKILRETFSIVVMKYPPVRITKNRLIIEAKLNWGRGYDQKLPLSIQYIRRIEENNDQFIIRKARMILDEQKKISIKDQYKRKEMTHKVGYFNKISKETKQTVQMMLQDFYNEYLY